MNAPDRIWATPFDEDMEGGTYCDATTRPTAPNHDAWCYIRTDLANSGGQPIEPQPDPRDEVIARLVGALRLMRSTYPYNPPCYGWEEQVEAHKTAKAALAAAKEVQHG